MTVETVIRTSDSSVEITVDEVIVIIRPERNTIRIVPGSGRTASATTIDTNSGALTIEISPRMTDD